MQRNETSVKRRIRFARRLRQHGTSAEEILWRELRGRRLDGWKFRRQVPIAGHIADFACISARLTVEVDGVQHLEQVESDRERTARIAAAGYFELRFTNDDVRGRPHWVIDEIRRALDAARVRPMRPALARLD
jgi:very-short-patch-repair endonuclease